MEVASDSQLGDRAADDFSPLAPHPSPLSLMNITFACPHCEAPNRTEVSSGDTALDCTHCGRQLQIPAGAIEQNRVHRCLTCPSTDLFIRKDFPQRLGVALVTIGLLGSCIAWAYSQLYWTFGILFATALIDVVLYAVVPNALMCYRCGTMYRGAANIDQHGSFNLEIHERHRQQKLRLAEVKHAAVPSQGLGVGRQETPSSVNS